MAPCIAKIHSIAESISFEKMTFDESIFIVHACSRSESITRASGIVHVPFYFIFHFVHNLCSAIIAQRNFNRKFVLGIWGILENRWIGMYLNTTFSVWVSVSTRFNQLNCEQTQHEFSHDVRNWLTAKSCASMDRRENEPVPFFSVFRPWYRRWIFALFIRLFVCFSILQVSYDNDADNMQFEFTLTPPDHFVSC